MHLSPVDLSPAVTITITIIHDANAVLTVAEKFFDVVKKAASRLNKMWDKASPKTKERAKV